MVNIHLFAKAMVIVFMVVMMFVKMKNVRLKKKNAMNPDIVVQNYAAARIVHTILVLTNPLMGLVILPADQVTDMSV